MKVGLLADTHDRLPAVRELARQLAARDVGLILHAGDWCAPFTVSALQRASAIPVIGVFGRCDGNRDELRAAASAGLAAELFESPHSLEVEGTRLLLVHELNDAGERSIAAHDIVVHGHAHVPSLVRRGETLLVNPGEACGWLHGTPTAAVLDLATREVEILRLTGPEWSS